MTEITSNASAAAAIPAGEQREAAEFVLRLGDALLKAGYPVNQVGELLLALSHQLELPQPQIYVTPTAIEVAIGPLTNQHRALLLTGPGELDLGQMTRLDRLASAVAAGKMTPRDGLARLATIARATSPFEAVLIGFSYAVAAAVFACTLNGGLREILVAALAGAATGVLAIFAQLFPRLERIFPPLAAFIVSLVVAACAAQVTPVESDLVTVAGLVILLPGLTVTVSLEELASGDLISGTVRLTSALITLFGLILGVALGGQLAGRLFGATHTEVAQALPPWIFYAAIVAAGLANTVRLKVERRDAIPVILAGLVAITAARFGTEVLGPQLGAFAAALVVGLVSNLFAYVSRRPAAVMQVPGLFMLVPGSIGFQSFEALFTAQTVSGIQAAFQMLLTAIALVYGIFVANLLLPPRHPFRTLLEVVSRIERTVLLRGGDGRSGRRRRG